MGVKLTPMVEAVEHVPGVPWDVLVGDWMLALFQNREMNLPGGCSKEGEREGWSGPFLLFVCDSEYRQAWTEERRAGKQMDRV